MKEINWTPEKIANFWDYEAQFPENYFTFNYGKSIIHFFSAYFENAGNCLDYGSGPGFFIPYLLEQKIKVTAVEFSSNAVRVLNEKFEKEDLFNGAFQVNELIASNKKFDLILCIEMIEHLNDNYLNELPENLKLLLNTNGTVIITTPNEENLSNSMIHCPECDTVFHRWQHVRSWSKKTLGDFLEKSGFEIAEICATDFSQFLLPKKTFKRKLLEFIKHNILFQEKLNNNHQPHLVAVAKIKN